MLLELWQNKSGLFVDDLDVGGVGRHVFRDQGVQGRRQDH